MAVTQQVVELQTLLLMLLMAKVLQELWQVSLIKAQQDQQDY
jgi:hypothetical protein